jgi:hypothetical protein
MAIKNISEVYCSLNLGLIYNLSYSWSPQAGASITVYFAKEDGFYQRPQYMQKAQIRIGPANFSMYVVASEIQLSTGRRVMEVTFMDETFMLDNYQIVLEGKGCGFNIYPLGRPVDNRSSAAKEATALDSTAQKIAEFTQFQDLEYTFNDFLAILRQKFNVSIFTSYDITLTAPLVGTFREVLDGWCQIFNLSWFVENSVIKIFDPTTLFIQLPTQPADAIEFNDLEDARDTYGKTCYNWYQQEGGQYPLNQTSNSNGSLLVRTNTLYPIGGTTSLDQNMLDLSQVTAAQYGQEFWLLYNYYKGSLNECGWRTDGLPSYQSATTLGATLAAINPTDQQQRFEAYQTYGEQIAGRYYMSNQIGSIAVDQGYTWFDESNGQITNFTNANDRAMNLDFLTPTNGGTNILPGTTVNLFYSGINYVGDRMVYRDDYIRNIPLTISTGVQYQINQSFSQFIVNGSESMNYSALPAGSYIMYNRVILPSSVTQIFDQITAVSTGFRARFINIPIKGITQSDYASLKASQSEPGGVNIIVGSEGGSVISNTAVIKTLEQGSYTVYYNKYQTCASAHTTGPYFGHRFGPRQISSDNRIDISFSKTSTNVYKLNRNYSVISSLVNNPFLSRMAQPRSTLTRRVSFTVNYFYEVPLNFLTNGLIGMNVSVGDRGITASYSFSNEVLAVPDYENEFAKFEQQIRNSWIRQYTPTTVIS